MAFQREEFFCVVYPTFNWVFSRFFLVYVHDMTFRPIDREIWAIKSPINFPINLGRVGGRPSK
jgi:hypothetical protein